MPGRYRVYHQLPATAFPACQSCPNRPSCGQESNHSQVPKMPESDADRRQVSFPIVLLPPLSCRDMLPISHPVSNRCAFGTSAPMNLPDRCVSPRRYQGVLRHRCAMEIPDRVVVFPHSAPFHNVRQEQFFHREP